MPPKDIEEDLVIVAEARAGVVEEAIALVHREESIVRGMHPLRRAEEYWEDLGPGLTTGAADDDPSGIATYSQAGAQHGLQMIWLALFTLPFMGVVQEMCARIGLVTGEGLAANIRRVYKAPTLIFVTSLLFVVNTFNIAADLGAMAAATRLLLPQVPAEMWVVFFALVMLVLQVFTTYATYSRFLKYLTLALLSYVAVAFMVGLNWPDVLTHTLLPSLTFSNDDLLLICAVLGTTISPYLFFWQTSQEVEEEILQGETQVESRRASVNDGAIKKMRVDIWTGMTFSNLVTFFIIAACAGTLYVSGVTTITTADQAAAALKPFGEFASLLFAIGIVGTGLLAVPVLAGSAAYAISESFGWSFGLYKKLGQAYAFYGVIALAMVLGVVANFFHLDPIRGLIYAAVGNGLIAPVILFFVVRLSARRDVMGERANKPFTNLVGVVAIMLMALAGGAVLLTFF